MLSTTFMPKPCFQFGDKESALIYDVFKGKTPFRMQNGRFPFITIRGHLKWPQRQRNKLHPAVQG